MGVAEGGIPVDYAHNLTYINGDTDGWAGVIPAVLVSLSRAFGIDLDTYLSAYGKQVTSQVSDQCINNFAGSYNGLTVQQLLKPQYQNLLGIPTFASTINHLIMGNAPGHPDEPLFMAVGNSRRNRGRGHGRRRRGGARARVLPAGRPGEFSEYENLDHTEAAAPFESAALRSWRRGSPAPRPRQRMRVDRGRQLAGAPADPAGPAARLHGAVLPAGHRQAERQHARHWLALG